MPIIKIGYLLIRTVSKPVANVLKHQTKDHPTFRSMCVRLAQAYHRTEIKMTRKLSGATNSAVIATVRPLDEQKAIELGANFIGEALVFFVAGTLLVIDNTLSAQKEQSRRQSIEDKFNELFTEVEEMKQKLTNKDKDNKKN